MATTASGRREPLQGPGPAAPFLQPQQRDQRLGVGDLATAGRSVELGVAHQRDVDQLADDGRLVVERQYRHPMGRVMLEFPAGKIDAGEPVWECAMRELVEETGYRAREWARAGVLHNAVAYSSEGIEIWFARGLVKGDTSLDEGEFIETFEATQDQLAAWVQDGSLTDAKTIIGLLWLEKWRDGRWDLSWQPTPAGPQCP